MESAANAEQHENSFCSSHERGRDTDPLVMKFGGTSVGSGAAFARAAKIAAGEATMRPVVVVVSAMSGVTDTLLSCAKETSTCDSHGRTKSRATLEGSLAELHRSLYERHIEAAMESVAPEFIPGVEDRISGLLGGLIGSLTAQHSCDDARIAEVVVHGERLSAVILSAAIRSRNISSEVAGDPIVTNSRFSEAEIDVAATRLRCAGRVESVLRRGAVSVVPGYVGRDSEERCTTLGRGGSDLSATVIGRGIGASEVWIMTDVTGVLDGDPRLLESAATLPVMSYREAHLFAGMGAKVLHHRTMEPAADADIEVYVRNSFEPREAGTLISSRECGEGVRSVALKRGLAISKSDTPSKSDVFCVLGCDGGGVRTLVEDEEGNPGEVAAIVGIGSPTDGDLISGMFALSSRGIPHLWAGNTASGVTFVVDAGDATDALTSLHAALIGRGAEIEVAV